MDPLYPQVQNPLIWPTVGSEPVAGGPTEDLQGMIRSAMWLRPGDFLRLIEAACSFCGIQNIFFPRRYWKGTSSFYEKWVLKALFRKVPFLTTQRVFWSSQRPHTGTTGPRTAPYTSRRSGYEQGSGVAQSTYLDICTFWHPQEFQTRNPHRCRGLNYIQI